MKLAATIFALVLFLSSVGGQDHYTNFKEYGARDGFNAFEYSGDVVKDKKGFLWIGSDNGLYRFDGQNFKAFVHDPGDPYSILSDNAWMIFIEEDGTFWVNKGVKGISHFDPARQRFHPWRNSNPSLVNIAEENINKVFQDRKKKVWLLIRGHGLAAVNKKDSSLAIFSFYKDPADAAKWMSTANLNDIAEDKEHIFWIASQAGLIRFDPETKAFTIFKDTAYGKENETRHTAINNVYVGDDEMIWVGTWGAGLKKFDPLKKSWETFRWDMQHLENSTRNIATTILKKSSNELWVTTLDGLLIFNTDTKKFTRLVSINAISGNMITGTKLYDDGRGNIWCSGLKPLTKLDTRNNIFRFQPVPDNPVYGSGHSVCNTFLADPADSLLFIGTYHSKGMHIRDQRTNEVTNYPLIKGKVFDENINQFLLDRNKNLWVCFNKGARLFDRRTKQYEFLSPSVRNASFLNSRIHAALEDDDGSIWFASRGKGLLLYDPRLKAITTFSPVGVKMPDDYILSLFKDSKGNIWLGYHGRSGLACINKNRKDIRFYNFSNYKIPEADVASITETKEGNIFFSLYIYGLGEIRDPLSGKDAFKLYTNANGLPGNKVAAVVKDKQQYLWISTNNGLSRCHTATMSFRNFTKADGLRDDYSESLLYCDAGGSVYIGNTSGFQFFNPALLDRNNDIPNVILHSFRIRGKEYAGDINAVNRIQLDYSAANFSFEYAALSFSNNDRIQYAYRLKGLDKDWRYAGSQRIAAYSLAHGGEYVLQIKASNPQGQWGEEMYELVIKVWPPFWETWWFITVCILLLGLVLYGFMRWRIRSIRASEERKTRINKIKAEAEMKALRAQMNPHFIFNCMNTIDAYIHKNNTEAASEFLHKFSSLIRLVLENSLYAFVTIKKDMEALQLYIELEEQRHDHCFTHEINLPQSLIEKNYKIPPLLVQPYAENAILHGLRHKEGRDGLLTISFTEENGQLVCLIDDNGIGRMASAAIYSHRQHHQSLGLKVSGERVASLAGLGNSKPQVSITDKPGGSGTIVKLELPKIDESM